MPEHQGRDAGGERVQSPRRSAATDDVAGGVRAPYRRDDRPAPVARTRRRSLPWRVRLGVWRESVRRFLIACAAEDLEARRGFLWLAVLFAGGALAYFSLPAEPALSALVLSSAAASALAVKTGQAGHLAGFRVACLVAAFVLGGTIAKVRTHMIAPDRITQSVINGELRGIIERIEKRGRGVRLSLRVTALAGMERQNLPLRVRVNARTSAASLAVGDRVAMRATLLRARGPVMPGGYDFAFDGFFRQTLFNGYGRGPVHVLPGTGTAADLPLGARVSIALARWRGAIETRIRAALSGEAGAFAVALIVGNRSGLSPATVEALRNSGLAHVLAISGLHMALAAGTAFLLVRAILGLFTGLAVNYPIKKWAAALALCAAGAYLVLSGASVATVRAFIMFAVALVAVLADRRAITMRNVAIAAIVIIALSPEAVKQPGFQMSFAAVISLIAVYEWRARQTRPVADLDSWIGISLHGARRFGVGLILTALFAGIATMPFAAFHFHRIASLGLLANVLAMPIVSFIVMPAGLIAMLAMPFGLEQPGLQIMAWGLDRVVAIAVWVAGFERAAPPIAAIRPLALGLLVCGGLWLALWQARWRWLGLGFFAAALLIGPFSPGPAVLIADNGRVFAARLADGLLHFSGRQNRFAASIWLRADGDRRTLDDTSIRRGIDCTRALCKAKLPGGEMIVLARQQRAVKTACTFAHILVTSYRAPSSCAASMVFDGPRLRRTGAVSLYWRGTPGRWSVRTARPRGWRPWFAPGQQDP